MESITCKKKLKQIFQTKKGFITCSKLIINELGHSLTRSDNIFFANNEQASIPIFIAVFYFIHTEHDLIKLEWYNNWSVQTVNSISECAMWNWKKPIKFAHL